MSAQRSRFMFIVYCRYMRDWLARVAPRHFALVALIGLISPLWVVTARGKELRIENFDAHIDVAGNGTIDVTETIRARFIGTGWHGLYRSIPVEYVTPQGLNYTLFLDVKQVTDGSGHRIKFDSSRVRHYRKLKIYIPNADNSVQTISIEYTVSDAIKFFEDHDELYWNVTGDEWDVPIQSAHAQIILPPGASNIRATAFTGIYGSRAKDAEIDIAGNGVEVRTTAPLPYHAGLTVAVAIDKGIIREPTAADLFWRFLRSNWPLFLPVAVFCVMFYLWWTRGRDPRQRPIAAQYEPPNQLTPGEAGTLVDNAANMRDITASIVDLAVRGYLVIEEVQKDRMLGLMHEKDYNFILQKDRSQWSPLKAHEQALLDGFFTAGTAGETISMDSLQNRFYKTLPVMRSGIFDSLVSQGFYKRRPDSVRSTYIGAGVVIGALMIWGGGAMGRAMGIAPVPFIIGGIVSGLIICGFGWFMPAHTEQGTRALEGVLGFEDFLNHVEADRFNRTIKTPQMFEKFLPFAMAFGVEKNWSKAFDGIMTQPPGWYRGSSGPIFYPVNFTSNLNSMSSRASSVMASAPRSSGGSGFGGGGSSGGGFGGGGGGGF
ncbi:MAG: hypothetical protein QOG55_1029 [Acidobacteriaceae bacterium]|jgi:uncharacterized membrane protein|nr:hypothetical protein [Acidobacteriaceae bacterium]